MSEYIVELDSKRRIALGLSFAEEMRGGDFIRGEIVRCRDCKRFHTNTNGFDCPKLEPDGFCAWGERREP